MVIPLSTCNVASSLFRRFVRFNFLLFLTLSLQAGVPCAQIDNDPPALEPGKPTERELAGGQSHPYRIALTFGQYLHVVVDQLGIDVVVSLYRPDGKPIIEVDTPNGSQGPETVSYIAQTSGPFLLTVRSLEQNAPAGRYSVKIEDLRPATEQEKKRVAADWNFAQAELLRERGTAESLEKSITKYEEALALYRAAGYSVGEARTLDSVGAAYYLVKEPRKALDSFTQALTLYRAARERGSEATMLNNMGLIYHDQGDSGKAFDYYAQAVQIYHAINDRIGEAATLGNMGAVSEEIGEPQKAIEYYTQAVLAYKAGRNVIGQAMMLNNIGVIYNSLGEKQKALDSFTQAISFYRAGKDRDGEATVLNNMGAAYVGLGEREKAFDNYAQALTIYMDKKDRKGQAATLSYTGLLYNAIGEPQKALDHHTRALSLYRVEKDQDGEATALNNIGAVYNSLGDMKQALNFYTQALPIYQAVRNRKGEATTLNNMGSAYSDLGDKQKALDCYMKALPIRHDIDDRDGEATTLNNMGSAYKDLGNLKQALDYFTQALPIYQAVRNRKGEAATLNNMGVTYDEMGDHKKALDYYMKALPIRRYIKDRSGEAATLNNIGRIHDDRGEKKEALDYYMQSLSIRRDIHDQRGEALMLNNIGGLYDEIGEKQKALDYYEQALPLSKAINNPNGEAATLNNMGAIYNSLGEKEKALDHYTQALKIYKLIKNQRDEAAALNNIAGTYNDYGEKQKALDYYQQALSLSRAVSDPSGEATTLNNIGAVYNSLGEQQKALDHYAKALPLHRAAQDRSSEATTLNNMGRAYYDSGNADKALNSYTQALQLHRDTHDRAGEATTLNNIGIIHDSRNEKKQALDRLTQALTIYQALKDPGGEATVLNNMGAIYSSKGEKQKALDHYTQALTLYGKIADRGGEATALENIAFNERNRGDFIKALNSADGALSIIESLRTKVVSKDLRSSYFATVHNLYEFYIDLLMSLHKQHPSVGYDAKALQASERARARSLLDLLTETSVDIHQGVDSKLIQRERSLQEKLNARAQAQTQLLTRPHTDKQETSNAGEINSLITELDQVRTEIRQNSPNYAALTQPVPLSLSDIQSRALDADTLLLEYSLGPERSYLWAITQTSISSYELPKKADIEQVAKAFRQILANRNFVYTGSDQAQSAASTAPGNPRHEAMQTALRLSRMLLDPVASQLGRKRLLIVADGALQLLPFAALIDPTAINEDSKNKQPLIVRHEIVNLPSVSILPSLQNIRAERPPAVKTLAMLADPVFSPDDERMKEFSVKGKTGRPKSRPAGPGKAKHNPHSAVAAQQADAFERLLKSETEALDVLALLPEAQSRRALGFDASRALVMSGELSQYRYVHFATHGKLDGDRPELSTIVLSMFDNKGKPQDGHLRLHEIYNLNLAADMVVLSACDTGLGKEIEGEGLIGLTRGFMYAGAARVVVSLWKVKDESTAKLMTNFYRALLKEGKRPAEALRAAQIEMLKQPGWQSPYYWSPFVLQGEWR